MFGVQREMHAYICGLRRLDTRCEEFDAIWPSHGSCPVSPELIGKLAAHAQGVLDRKFAPEQGEMFGKPITKYNVGDAVFLCE